MKGSTRANDIRAELGMIDSFLNTAGSDLHKSERVRNYVTLVLGKKRFKADMPTIQEFKRNLEEELAVLRPKKVLRPDFREPEKNHDQETKHMAVQKRQQRENKKVESSRGKRRVPHRTGPRHGGGKDNSKQADKVLF